MPKAKYKLGADGAHSWVSNQLGFELKGDSTDYVWGVLDILSITDIPNIRMRCAIHPANAGSVMVIPWENRLVRPYIQLTTTNTSDGSKVDRLQINPHMILEFAQRILAPYSLSYRKLDWWTVYQTAIQLHLLKERRCASPVPLKATECESAASCKRYY